MVCIYVESNKSGKTTFGSLEIQKQESFRMIDGTIRDNCRIWPFPLGSLQLQKISHCTQL